MMTAPPRELLAQGQALRLGFVCMYVDNCPDGSCHSGERDQVTLNLTPTVGRLDSWLDDGGLIGAQAIAPIAALETGARLQHCNLAVGPGAALPALGVRVHLMVPGVVLNDKPALITGVIE